MEKQIKEFNKCYQKAIQGNSENQFELGLYYYAGYGVKESKK
jgi:TPR repeat protein